MGAFGLFLAISYAFVCSYIYLEPTLPSVAAMKNNELQVPLRVYTRSGDLIAQIGEQRRNPVQYEQIPLMVRQAFIAAEDDRFFQHHGFDWQGVLRMLLVNLASADFAQGASTITMQTARSAYINQEQTVRRKLQEVFVTYRLEHEFTKEEILALYLNVIFFGQRAYGVAAAAETYFGKQLDELTLGEAATLARVQQSPSKYNPITNPGGAAERRSYVLRRMRELGFITPEAETAAKTEVVKARAHRAIADVEAPYVAEMVRLEVKKRFGDAALEAGYKVYTTLDGRLQTAANRALRMGLVDYDRRHGWRGPRAKVELTGSEGNDAYEQLLDEFNSVGILNPAVVVSVAEKQAKVFVKGRGPTDIAWEGLSWARRKANELALGPEPKTASEVVARGDVVYVSPGKEGGPVELAQVPEPESALIALDPNDGAIISLVGGFDYFEGTLGKFNRAMQAERQLGSGFKPFLYAAALAGTFTPASVILDAPVIVDDPNIEEVWRPENDGGSLAGPLRLREALVRSRNLVSIRLLREMGVRPVIEYAQHFGFKKESLPPNLTLALGTVQAPPIEVATGYTVFANGGFKVEPYFIDRIEGPGGQIVFEAAPLAVCAECAQPIEAVSKTERAKGPLSVTNLPPSPTANPRTTHPAPRVIGADVAFMMNDIMRDVITRGTGRRALALGRSDLRGKTGTTNLGDESIDTWFNGFNNNLVASVWVGFDQIRSLGPGEEGARTAVPIWVEYMREALKGVPDKPPTIPEGVVELKVNAMTGGTLNAELDPLFEYFRADNLPTPEGYVVGDPDTPVSTDPQAPDAQPTGADPIF
jgi:penicillin-binding protein 1A